MSLPTAVTAARNNAEWCDLVCRTHGAGGTFDREAWSTSIRSPRYYPDAVTLRADAAGDRVLTRVDTSAGCSIKDSFATLDLAPAGFRVLFDAEWIGRPAARDSSTSAVTTWQRVTDPRVLNEWETAWADPDEATTLFRPELLDDPDVVVLCNRVAGELVYGAMLNRAAGAVGLTNVFTRSGDLDAVWNAAGNAASACFPDEPIVGYESGDDLAAAQRCGCVSLGPLRVWINDES